MAPADEETGFDAPSAPKNKELDEAVEILNTANEEGEDVLTEYETEFAEDVYDKIKAGRIVELSDPQKEMVHKIKAKLEREGIL